MLSEPVLGIPLHWLGGLASGCFYVPYRGVRQWSWEIYWLLGGVFSWILCPWIFATLLTKNLPSVIATQPSGTLLWTYFFGVLWGFGGLTYGLTTRYLGLSAGHWSSSRMLCSVRHPPSPDRQTHRPIRPCGRIHP